MFKNMVPDESRELTADLIFFDTLRTNKKYWFDTSNKKEVFCYGEAIIDEEVLNGIGYKIMDKGRKFQCGIFFINEFQ